MDLPGPPHRRVPVRPRTGPAPTNASTRPSTIPTPIPSPAAPGAARRAGASGTYGGGTPEPNGFTLVEALLVIAILALQLGLMLPVLARTTATVRGSTCLGHLRQWGLATQLYATDHDDFLPPEGVPNPTRRDTNQGWYIQLPRQLDLPPYHSLDWPTNREAQPRSSLWLCPANRRRSNGLNLFHYCLNQGVDGTGSDEHPIRLGSVSEPGRLVWLFDSKNLPAVGPGNYAHTNLHGAGANFLFLDGHARRLPVLAYWDFTRRRARTNSALLSWLP